MKCHRRIQHYYVNDMVSDYDDIEDVPDRMWSLQMEMGANRDDKAYDVHENSWRNKEIV